MNYICTRCGFLTDELPKMTERHPVGDGYSEETVSSWVHSCGGEFDCAKTCKICGETKSEEDNLFHGDICEQCLKMASTDFDLVKKCSDKGNVKAMTEVDSLVLVLLSGRDINEILWKIVLSAHESSLGAECKKADSYKASRWALADMDWFSDMICEVSEFG